MATHKEEDLYCVCRRPYKTDQFMIECDICKDWFHGSCVDIEEYQCQDIEAYHCPNCQPEHGPLVLKRRRNWHRHDYSEINDGKKAVQSGTVVFVDMLKKKSFPSAKDVILGPRGSEVTFEWFNERGFNKPLVIDQPEGLGLVVPPSDFTVADVEHYVGSLRDLDVIDVSRQDDLRMKMREWVQYYDTKPRPKILNVISLEFSDTKLNRLVEAPKVVREIDWINKHWPKVVPDDFECQRPSVQKYCLMSVQDSYTDFHVDFGGTSVWYHIIKGEKVFYLIPPTEENLLLYEQWVSSSHQSEVFFGSEVDTCYTCTLHPGNTLFIPTGWIHAVLTPKDSLVFGGNFLHRFNIDLQLRIYEMERRLQTPLKFRHPSYEALTWFASRNLLKELKAHEAQGTRPPDFLIKGIKVLTECLSDWSSDRQALKAHKHEIPTDLRPSRNISDLNKYIDILTTEDRPVANIPANSTHHQRSIKLRFSHGNLTRHEIDGDQEHITMKLSLPQRKKKAKMEPDEDSLEHELDDIDDDEGSNGGDDEERKRQYQLREDEDYDSGNDKSGDDEYVYSKSVSHDDAGAIINDKDDGLWNPKYKYKVGGAGKKRQYNIKMTTSEEIEEMPPSEKKKKIKKESKKGLDIVSLKPISKPKTTKQRLGKLLGLDRSGHFLKK